MLQLLCPKLLVRTVAEVSPRMLLDKGIDAVILDVDNTVLPWRSRTVSSEVLEWISGLRSAGLRLCALSNGINRGRAAYVRDVLGLPVPLRWAVKPMRRAFRAALGLMGASACRTAMVGDQVFTDILGGNLMGLFTILVSPLSRRELATSRVVRHLERVILATLERRGMIRRPMADT